MIRSRFNAVIGEPVRLYIRVYLNGVLYDPSSVGPIVISRKDTRERVASFTSPVKEGTGTYYVQWNIPSNDPTAINYSSTFFGDGNYQDSWYNIVINESLTVNKVYDFYVAENDGVESNFSDAEPMIFTYEMLTPVFQKGARDYVTIAVTETASRLTPGVDSFPNGEIRIKKGQNIISNFSSALHKDKQNRYSTFIDTTLMDSGIYLAQLKFDMTETTSTTRAMITGSSSLRSGFTPNGRQTLVLEIDGNKQSIDFVGSASKGSVTSSGKIWGIPATIIGSYAWDNTTITKTLAGTFDLEIDSITYPVEFLNDDYNINDAIDVINTAVGGNVAYSTELSGAWAIAINSISVGDESFAKCYNFSTTPLSVFRSRLGLPEMVTGLYGTTATVDFSTPTTNNILSIAVDNGGYQEVNAVRGTYNGANEVATQLNVGNKQAYVINKSSIVESTVVGKNFSFNVDGTLYNKIFTGTDPLSIDEIISQINSATSIPSGDSLPSDVASKITGNYIKISSLTVGAGSSVTISNGSANTSLNFVTGMYSYGNNGIVGAVVDGDTGQVRIKTNSTGASAKLQIGDVNTLGSTINSTIGFSTNGVVAYGSDASGGSILSDIIDDEDNIVLTPYTSGSLVSSLVTDTYDVDGKKFIVIVDDVSEEIILEGDKTEASLTGGKTISVSAIFTAGLDDRLIVSTTTDNWSTSATADFSFGNGAWGINYIINKIKSEFTSAGIDADVEWSSNRLRIYHTAGGDNNNIRIGSFDGEQTSISGASPSLISGFHNNLSYGTGALSGYTGTGSCAIVLDESVIGSPNTWPSQGTVYLYNTGSPNVGEYLTYEEIDTTTRAGTGEVVLVIANTMRGGFSTPIINWGTTYLQEDIELWPKIGSTANYMFGYKNGPDPAYNSTNDSFSPIEDNGLTSPASKNSIINQLNDDAGFSSKAVASLDVSGGIKITSLSTGDTSKVSIDENDINNEVPYHFLSSTISKISTEELLAGSPSPDLYLNNVDDIDSSGFICIDEEIIEYTGVFPGSPGPRLTGLVRGVEQTAETTHIVGSLVKFLNKNESIGTNGNNRLLLATKQNILNSSWETITLPTGNHITTSSVISYINNAGIGVQASMVNDPYVGGKRRLQISTITTGSTGGWIAVSDDSSSKDAIGLNGNAYITSTADLSAGYIFDSSNYELNISLNDDLHASDLWIPITLHRNARLIAPYIGLAPGNGQLDIDVVDSNGATVTLNVSYLINDTLTILAGKINAAAALESMDPIASLNDYSGNDYMSITSPYTGSAVPASVSIVGTSGADYGFLENEIDTIQFTADGNTSFSPSDIVSFISKELSTYTRMINENESLGITLDYSVESPATGIFRIINETAESAGIGSRISLRQSSVLSSPANGIFGFPEEGVYMRVGGGNIPPGQGSISGYSYPNEFNTGASAQPAKLTATGITYPIKIYDYANNDLVLNIDQYVNDTTIVMPDGEQTLQNIIDYLNGDATVYGIGHTWSESQIFIRDVNNELRLTVDGDIYNIDLLGIDSPGVSSASLSLQDVVTVINSQCGITVASTWENRLLLKYNGDIIVSGEGTANVMLGFPHGGMTSEYKGSTKLYNGNVSDGYAWAYRSSYDKYGQLTIQSKTPRSDTYTSSIQILSESNGSIANSTIGFDTEGVGPVVGNLGTNFSLETIISMINGSFGAGNTSVRAVASAAGDLLRLESIGDGEEAYITVHTATSDDVLIAFGLSALTVYGTTDINLAQTIYSPFLQFQIV